MHGLRASLHPHPLSPSSETERWAQCKTFASGFVKLVQWLCVMVYLGYHSGCIPHWEAVIPSKMPRTVSVPSSNN